MLSSKMKRYRFLAIRDSAFACTVHRFQKLIFCLGLDFDLDLCVECGFDISFGFSHHDGES